MKTKKPRLLLGACLCMAASIPSASASVRSDDEKDLRFTIDGAFTWMGTRGNDARVGEVVTIDESFDLESGAITFEERGNALVTEMRNRGVPWAQIGLQKGKWGVAAEFWTLDTDGSTTTGEDAFDAFRYHDVSDTLDGLLVNLQAANELSVWTARVMVLRAVSKSLTLGAGIQTGELDNRRNETLDLTEPLFIFGSVSARVETSNKTAGALIGPSLDLRGSANIGGRASVRFAAAQSLLFAKLDNEAVWQSAITAGESIFLFLNSRERFSLDSTTRAAIPVTDARAVLTFDLGSHVSVGLLGLLSVWLDAPLAHEFSQATGGWDPVSSTLVFASVGPIVSIRF